MSEKEGFTMAWKLYTPSLSKRNASVHWDWSNKRDGIRVFEAFCADLTGHPSYIIIRITRNTEKECRDEFNGQLTDGYFENYNGSVKGKEIEPYSFRLNRDCVRHLLDDRNQYLAEYDKEGHTLKSLDLEYRVYTLAAAMSCEGYDPKPVIGAKWKMQHAWTMCFGWHSEDNVERRSDFENAVEAFNNAVKLAFDEFCKIIV